MPDKGSQAIKSTRGLNLHEVQGQAKLICGERNQNSGCLQRRGRGVLTKKVHKGNEITRVVEMFRIFTVVVDASMYIFAKTQRTTHLISVHLNTCESNLYETKGFCWGKKCMLSATPRATESRTLRVRVPQHTQLTAQTVRRFPCRLRRSPERRPGLHHYTISPRTADLYSLNQVTLMRN